MNPIPFRGMMPIMPTAITEDGAVDEASQRRVVQYCLECGAVAIGHFGYASEFHKISDPQRSRLTEIIVDEVAGSVPVFLGVASPATHISVAYAREAEALGADILMATLPFVDVPNAREAMDYYRALSDASSLPIIVQDAPHCAGVFTADFLMRLIDEVDHVLYVKAEGADFMTKTAALLARAGERAGVIGGAAGKHLIHMLRLGVTSFMTGTEAVDLHGAVVHAYLEGREEEAAKLYYEKVLPYLLLYMDYSAELLKEMLRRRGVIDCAKVIPPEGIAPMSDAVRAEFEWAMKRVGLP